MQNIEISIAQKIEIKRYPSFLIKIGKPYSLL